MDSLTQIVLGAAVGEAVIGKKVGNKAMLWGAIAGTIPDLDVLSKYFVDNVTANEWHRGFSHSILFSLLIAPILGWIISQLYNNEEADWKDWTKLIFMGIFTHPILDAFTTWGTQLFWPLDYKISFKNIFVVDPLYTVPFLTFVLIAMFYQKNHPTRRKLNNLGLLISTSYMFLTLGIKWYTYGIFKQSIENQNISYQEIQTKPTALNSILWSTNVKTKDSFMIGYYSLLDEDENISFLKFPKNHELLGTMKNTALVSRLIKLSEGWYTIEKISEKVIFNDLRFGLLGIGAGTNRFVFSYELYYDDTGQLKAKERERATKQVAPMLKKLFRRILGNKS